MRHTNAAAPKAATSQEPLTRAAMVKANSATQSKYWKPRKKAAAPRTHRGGSGDGPVTSPIVAGSHDPVRRSIAAPTRLRRAGWRRHRIGRSEDRDGSVVPAVRAVDCHARPCPTAVGWTARTVWPPMYNSCQPNLLGGIEVPAPMAPAGGVAIVREHDVSACDGPDRSEATVPGPETTDVAGNRRCLGSTSRGFWHHPPPPSGAAASLVEHPTDQHRLGPSAI
jgi:hypothetical protein